MLKGLFTLVSLDCHHVLLLVDLADEFQISLPVQFIDIGVPGESGQMHGVTQLLVIQQSLLELMENSC